MEQKEPNEVYHRGAKRNLMKIIWKKKMKIPKLSDFSNEKPKLPSQKNKI